MYTRLGFSVRVSRVYSLCLSEKLHVLRRLLRAIRSIKCLKIVIFINLFKELFRGAGQANVHTC